MWPQPNNFDRDRFDRGRFADTNLLSFSPAWGNDQIEWWLENMYVPYGLYPDDLGEMLSASVQVSKVVTLLDMEPRRGSFVIRVKEAPGETGEVWWHQRSLDLKGRLFTAERMVVPLKQQRKGTGRVLMADLVDTSLKLGLKQIAVEAQDIGRYVWARFGFVPDRGSWRYRIQLEAPRRLRMSERELSPAKYRLYRDMLDRDDPLVVREIARWPELVDSTQSFDEGGNPLKIAIGKALLLETPADWSGAFDLEDPETMRIFEEYVGRAK
jgi:GNAT superfamily N-acetyltransferase